MLATWAFLIYCSSATVLGGSTSWLGWSIFVYKKNSELPFLLHTQSLIMLMLSFLGMELLK